MESHKPDLKTLFCEALERPAGPERLAYLDEACRDNPALRAQVEDLVSAQERAAGFLDSAAGAATSASTDEPDEDAAFAVAEPAAAGLSQAARTDGDATADATNPASAPSSQASRPLAEGPGSRIGPYKLLQEIGQGGMGVVYLAEQEKPVRRRVALKIIKPGMDTQQVVGRFEAERQALALMDHPSIAKVFDAGSTDTGRPYFVMELVKGVPITEYCDTVHLTPRERLELFIPVCQAIQHAHQKGIIHRDVKPSNVLVAMQDGKPIPKVIDFGIAKATEQRLTERSLYTQHGAIIGTLEYMSPEQAEMSALDVDTRTDIYALGVMLYELLTGTTPLQRQKLREAGYAEILRRIREEEPPKPRTRLSESRDSLASISAQRRTEPTRLTKLLRRELDWIAMKAIEKDRTRRYETASAFARDIERYLNDEPVEAGPPSPSYRLRKYARKHRAALTTAGAFAGLLVVAAAVSTWQAYLATQARNEAQESYKQSQLNETKAKEQEAQARHSAAESEAVLKFFQDHVLSAARPEGQEGGLGKDVTIRKAIDAAAPKIAASFKDQPTVEASIRTVLGSTYYYLGEPSLAIRQFEHAGKLRLEKLGPDHADTLDSRNDLALAYWSAGRTAEAIELQEETLKRQAAKLGPDDPQTLASANNLALAYQAAGRIDEAIGSSSKRSSSGSRSSGPITGTRFSAATISPTPIELVDATTRRAGCTRRHSDCSRPNLGPTAPRRSRSGTTSPSPIGSRGKSRRPPELTRRRSVCELRTLDPTTLIHSSAATTSAWTTRQTDERPRRSYCSKKT
jgi:serine/threonine protein kinase